MISKSCIILRSSSYGMWVLFAFLLAGCNKSPSGPPFDPRIKGFELVKLITGDDAIKAINQLHAKPINLLRGFIAQYKGIHDEATIWVSEASSQELAQRQIAVMIEKMKNSARSPFSHYRTFDSNGIKVIAFDGMGQVHYVFKRNAWVYWITADAKCVEKILRHVQRTL